MRQFFLALACAAISIPAFANTDYRDGWNAENFYESVNFCRKSIVFPQSQDFITQAEKNGESPDVARNKAIKMSPAFDKIVTDVCFCTVNEIARDNSPGAFPDSVDIQAYMGIPRCKSAMEAAVQNVMGDKRKLRELMLP